MEDLNLDIAGAIEDIRTALAGGAVGLITSLPWQEADPSFPRLSPEERERLLVWVEVFRGRAVCALAEQDWEGLSQHSLELSEQLKAYKCAGNNTIETAALSNAMSIINTNAAILLATCHASP